MFVVSLPVAFVPVMEGVNVPAVVTTPVMLPEVVSITRPVGSGLTKAYVAMTPPAFSADTL